MAASGTNSMRAQLRDAQREIEHLEEQLKRAQDANTDDLLYENEKLRRQLDGIHRERGELAHEREDVDAQLEDERSARQELNKALRAAEANVARLDEDLAAKNTELAKLNRARDADKREAARLRAAATARSTLADTSTDELLRTARESEHMRAELAQLKLEVRIQRGAAQEAEDELTEVLARNEELGAALQEAKAEVGQLNDVVSTLREELSTARNVGEEGVQTAVAESHAQELAVQRASAEAQAAKESLDAALGRVRLLEDELSAVKAETRVASLETELDMLREQLAAVQTERDELAEEAAGADADLRSLAADAAAADQALADAVRDAREQERARLSDELSRVDELKAELERERQRFREVEEQLSDTQARLEEAKFRCTQYEAEYGMSDLVSELDAMRVENQRLQKDLGATGEDLRERMDTVYVLTEIARRLAQETGKYPADVNVLTIYDTGDLAAQHASLVEQLKADNTVLERQVEQLQQERVRLMRDARVHARQAGEDGLFYFGLTGEQMRLVDEFAENLREGRVELPERDDSAALRRQLDAVRRELHEERARFTEASLAYADNVKGAAKPGSSESAAAEAAGATRKLLEDIRTENAKLQDALLAATKQQAEAAAAAALAAGQGGDADGSSVVSAESHSVGAASAIAAEPLVARVISALQSAVASSKSIKKKDTSTVLRAMRALLSSRDAAQTEAADALKRLSGAEGAAAAEREKADVLRSEVGKLLAQLTQAQAAAASASASAQAQSEHRTTAHPAEQDKQTGHNITVQLPGSADAHELSAFVQVLRGYVASEKAASALQGDGEQYQAVLGQMLGQLALLYKQHAAARALWTQQCDAAAKDSQRAQAEADGHKARAERSEASMHALLKDASDASAAAELKSATRELTALQVQVPQLQRRAAVAEADAHAASARAAAAESAVIDLETTLQARILYLETWKAGASARLSRADEVLRTWVPPAHAEAATQVLQGLRHKHAQLCASECALRLQLVELRSVARADTNLAHQNQLLASKVAEARAQTAALEQRCNQLQQAAKPTSGADEEHKVAALRADVARLTGEAGAQRVTAEAAAERARILQERVSELQAEAAREAGACKAAAQSLAAAQADAREAADARDQALRRYAGALDADAAKALRQQVSSAEDKITALEREVQRLRGIADIAADQAASSTALIQYRHEELRAAKSAALKASAVTSDGAIVGKLQAEMLALKGSYAAFVRRYATLRASFQRLCTSHAGLEAALDQRTAQAQEAVQSARAMELAAQQLVASVRDSGADHNQLSGMKAQLDQLLQRAELSAQDMSQYRTAAAEAQAARDQADIAVQALQRGCLDILAALGVPGVGSQTDSSSPQYERIVQQLQTAASQSMPHGAALPRERLAEVATRALASAEAVRSARAVAAKLRRQLGNAQDELQLASRRVVSAEDALANLEEENSLLRAQVAQAAAATVSSSMTSGGPGAGDQHATHTATHTSGRSSRAAQATVADATAQGEELARLRQQLHSAGQQTRTAQRKASQRSAQIQYLLGQLRMAGVEIDDLQIQLDSDLPGDHDAAGQLRQSAASDKQLVPAHSVLDLVKRAGSPELTSNEEAEAAVLVPSPPPHIQSRAQVCGYYARHISQLRAAAQQSVESLRAMLDAKNRMLQAYQTKISGLQDELSAARASAVSARAVGADSTTEPGPSLYELRSAVADMQRSSTGAPSHSAAAALLPALATRVDELEQALASAEAAHASSARRTESSANADSAAQVQALQAEVARLSAAATQPSMQTELKTLQAELEAKDKRLHALQMSLVALKDEFIKLESEKSAADQTSATGPAQPSTELAETQARISQLQRALKAARRTSAELEGKLRAVQAAGDADRAEALEHREAASRAWGEVKKLRRQMQKLQAAESLETQAAQAAAVPAPSAPERTRPAATVGQEARDAELCEKLAVLSAQNAALKAAAAQQRHESSEAPRASAPSAPSVAHVEQVERARRQVNVLSGRLRERTDQLQQAQQELSETKSRLKSALSDADHLRKRLAAAQQRTKALDASASAALSELAPIADLTARVAELEAALAEAKNAVDGDGQLQMQQLRAQAKTAEDRAAAAESSAQEARAAVANVLAQHAGAQEREPGSVATVTTDGSAALNPAQLREQLAAARKRVAELDGSLLASAAELAHAQYQAAAATMEAEQHARRVRELSAIAAVVSASGRRPTPAKTQDQGQDKGSNSRTQRSLNALRDTIATLKRTAERQARDVERLRARLRAAEAAQSATTSHDATHTERVDSAARAQARALQQEVAALQQQLEAARSASTAPATDEARADTDTTVAHLRSENKQLRQELSAFDAEFFEELEDLKYKYAAALAKCRAFDQYLASAGMPPTGSA